MPRPTHPYVLTWAAFLFLAVVLDAFGPRVVEWAMATHLKTELVLGALEMARVQRRPAGVIHHSDHGTQYASLAFGERSRVRGQAVAAPLFCEQEAPMNRDTLLARIMIDPNICFGKPCIRGHRIWVSLVLDFLAEGMTTQEILAEYPDLTADDVRACIAYGAEMARERYVDVSGPKA